MSNCGSITPHAHAVFLPLPPSSPPSPPTPHQSSILSSPPPSSPCHPSVLPFTPYPIPLPAQSFSPRRPRACSLPPISSDDIIRSSPIIGTAAQHTLISRQKRQVKRGLTMKTNREALFREDAKKLEEALAAHRTAEEDKHSHFSSILEALRNRGYSFGQLVLYVSDPVYKQGFTRWDGMLKEPSFVSQILGLWAFKASTTTQDQVRNWAVSYVAKEVRQEVKKITTSQFLQTRWRPIDSKLVLGFNVSTIHEHFLKHGSTFMTILNSLTTSPKQLKKISPTRLLKKATVRD
jgi:hypothetical protein